MGCSVSSREAVHVRERVIYFILGEMRVQPLCVWVGKCVCVCVCVCVCMCVCVCVCVPVGVGGEIVREYEFKLYRIENEAHTIRPPPAPPPRSSSSTF